MKNEYVIKHKELEACFINSNINPIKTEHICYYSKLEDNKITLFEVVKEFYPHPEAPEDMLITKIDTHRIRNVLLHTRDSAALELLLSAQNNI